MILRFRDYELDRDAVALRHSGEQVHIEPQVYDVLAYLIENRERLVPKEELLDEVWGDRFVSESALTSRIKAARKAVGDDGRTQAVIRTAHGRGYRFVAPVEVVERIDTTTRVDARPRRRFGHDPILGREGEVAAVAEMLDEVALVTVVGPGGTGKTRLAEEVLEIHAGGHGILVELAPVRDSSAIPYTIANELGIQVGQRSDPVAACVEFLAATPHLLVLDNCEHLLEAAARLAHSLLEQCPHLSILATSREPIGLFSERVFRLEPLGVPAPGVIVDPTEAGDIPALALFAERAKRVNSDFELDASSIEPVMDLCRALDGLPLAIELAASRMGALELNDIVDRLDRRLDLVGDARSAVGGRHRTLRSLIEWSYDLLEPDEQKLLRFLSAFPAGADLNGIEWLGEQLDLESDATLALAHLVEASMVGRARTHGLTQYRQLDTVQAFGTDQLEAEGEVELAATLLKSWALRFAAEINRGVTTADEGHWDRLARLAVPNLRAARQALLDSGDLAGAVQLSRELTDWLQFRDLEELQAWTDELYLLTVDADPELRTTAMTTKCCATWARGDHSTALALAQEIIGRDPDPWCLARATSAIAVCSMYQGDLETAAAEWRKRIEIDQSPMDSTTLALPLAYLGRPEQASAAIERGMETVRRSGSPSHLAWSYYVRGEIEHEADSGLHVDYLERAVTEAEAVGAAFMVGVAKVTLVSGQFRDGDLATAAGGFLELIDYWLRAGNWSQMWVTLRNVAELLADIDAETALLLLAGADADPFATAMTEAAREQLTELLAPAVDQLGAEEVARIEARAAAIDRTEHAEVASVALRRYLAEAEN